MKLRGKKKLAAALKQSGISLRLKIKKKRKGSNKTEQVIILIREGGRLYDGSKGASLMITSQRNPMAPKGKPTRICFLYNLLNRTRAKESITK